MALNDEAIAKILLRLPAKSVCRFRCVSQHWLYHTSSPRFILAHAAAAPAEPSGFYLYAPCPRPARFFSLDGGGGGSHKPTLSFLDYEGIRPEPVDSCNGLLLCVRPQKHYTWKPFTLIVCNPTNKELKVIRWSDAMRRPHEITTKSLRLAFDPRRSPHYTILAVETPKLTWKYTSENRSWKRIEDGTLSTWPCRPSVYWNGSFVWSADYNMLAALDLEEEQIRALLLPAPRKIQKFLHLAVSGDRLHYIRGENQTLFEILEMTSVSSGWRVLHTIDLGSVYPPCDSPRRLLEFIRGEDDDQLLLHMPTKIVSYHPRQQIFTTIRQVNQAIDDYNIFPLAHTLFPLQMKSSIRIRKKMLETAYGTCIYSPKPKYTTMHNADDVQCREEQESVQGEDGQESVTRRPLLPVNTMDHAARERMHHAARERMPHAARERMLRLVAEYRQKM